MSINVEQLIVGLIFLVPGFISTSAERIFQPRRFKSAYDWTSSSLIRSIVLNLLVLSVALSIFICAGWLPPEILFLKVKDISQYSTRISLGETLLYIGGLYLVSAISGALIGIYPELTLRALANRFSLTSLGEADSVWKGIKAHERQQGKRYTWIKVSCKEGKTYFGRLKRASAIVEQEKPIELFLRPAYELHQSQLKQLTCMGLQADGLYIRLQAADTVEFYFTTGACLPLPGQTV